MGSRYLFIVIYVFLEHHLSRGDYRGPDFKQHPGRGERRRLSLRRPAGDEVHDSANRAGDDASRGPGPRPA